MLNSSDDEDQRAPTKKSDEEEIDDIQIDPKQIELEEAKFIEE